MFTIRSLSIHKLEFHLWYNWLQKREFLKVVQKPKDVIIGPRDLATNTDLVKTLRILPEKEYKYFMIFMILSGRRGKDIEELTWQGIKIRNGNWTCILPRDKCNRNNLVSFEICFPDDWDLDFDIEEFKKWVKNGIRQKRGKLFEKIERTGKQFSRQVISYKCKLFKPHSIRNRKALVMLINGNSEATVMSRIGWSNMQSILRYAKISIHSVKQFNNYTDLVENLLEF